MTDADPIRPPLAQRARDLPREPGVYLMKDARGRVIYIGKARSLRNRVGSYFVPSADLGPKKQRMLALIDDFDHIVCESEWEALLTENRLIKDLHPRFNARLTDDKTFPYLVVTTRDEFPGVYVTREPTHPDYRGARVFGPFTSVYALREAVQLLQRVFRFRTCTLDIRSDDETRRHFRPCLLYPIKQCTAPCAAKIDKPTYRRDIDRLVKFMGSKRSAMLREMRREMEQAARDLEFETAAALRDQVKALEKLGERGHRKDRWQPETETLHTDPKRSVASLQRALGVDRPLRTIDCFDIAHLQGELTVGSRVCFVDGRPLKSAYRRYRVRTATNDDYAAMREVVSRAYRDAGAGQELYPDLILVDGGPSQLESARQALADYPHQPPLIVALAKKDELLYMPGRDEPIRLGRENPGLKLCQALRDEAHRFARHYHHLLRRKKMLDGGDPPKRSTA